MPLPPHKNIGVVDATWVKLWATGRKPLEATWEAAAAEVESMREYIRTDGHVAPEYGPLSHKCVDAVVALLAHLKVVGFPPPWCAYPCPAGGSIIEWDFDAKWNEDGSWAGRGGHMSVYFMDSRPDKAEAMFTEADDTPTVFADLVY